MNNTSALFKNPGVIARNIRAEQVPPSAPKKCLTKYPRIQDDMWKLSRLKLKNAQALLSKFRSKLEAKTKCEITEKIV
ncbi:MAG: hypothetical protein PHP83_00225 [Clostridia bacterium]|nr:hypothetical protein [Clostridia bacterium]